MTSRAWRTLANKHAYQSPTAKTFQLGADGLPTGAGASGRITTGPALAFAVALAAAFAFALAAAFATAPGRPLSCPDNRPVLAHLQ